jgi:hypothetical protein
VRNKISPILTILSIALATVSACGTGHRPTRSPATTASPSSSSAQSLADFCGDLNAFSTAAGPTFDLEAFGILNKHQKPSRKALSSSVTLILLIGPRLMTKLPSGIHDDLRLVLGAASEAAKKLATDTPPDKAVAALTTAKASAARKKITDYRGPC